MLTFALFLFVLIRFGLFAAIASDVFTYLLPTYPVASGLAAWYAGSFLFFAAVFVALAGYGFYISLAGRPLFGGDPLEE